MFSLAIARSSTCEQVISRKLFLISLTVCDTEVSALVRRWLHWGMCHLSASHCVIPEADCPVFCCYKECLYKIELRTHLRCLNRQVLSEALPSLFALCREFNHLFFARRFGFWAQACNLEFHLCRHAKNICRKS